MGGDAAPRMVLSGANIARKRFPDVRFIFFGREDELRPQLEKLKALAAVSTIVHTDQVVSAEEYIDQLVMVSGLLQAGAVVFAVFLGSAAVVLIGNLGAGKTTLAKGIAAGLGAAEPSEVSSPTFTLVHEYGDPVSVYHVDLYRKGKAELGEHS